MPRSFSAMTFAGILAVTTTPLGAQSVRTFTLTRDLTISSAVADLSRVGEFLVTRTGEILITDYADKVVRTFSPTGQPGKFGRAGEGPGEIHNLRLAGLIGDSVWISDPALERITIFGPDHKFVRSFRYPSHFTNPAAPTAPVPMFEFSSPGAIYPDGSLQMVLVGRAPGPAPSWVKPADTAGTSIIIRTTPDGAFKARIRAESSTPMDCKVSAGGGTWFLRNCAKPVTTALAGASDFVEVTAPHLLGPNTSYHVTLIDANGDTRISRDYPIVPVMVSKASRDSDLARTKTGVSIKWPVTYPPVRNIVVGRDGTLWLEESALGPGHHWAVLDRSGNPIGRVDLPMNVTLRVADLNAIWGLEEDADGLQGVVRYRVTRRN